MILGDMQLPMPPDPELWLRS